MGAGLLQCAIIQGSHTIPKMKFPTFSWLYDPYSLPILHEIVWNLFTYREYFKILNTRGYSFLTIWFYLWSNIMFIVLMNCVFQHIWKHEIPYFFLTLWPISHPFPTLSANSLPFQGLKKMISDSWLFQYFPYQWESCIIEYWPSGPHGAGLLQCAIIEYNVLS